PPSGGRACLLQPLRTDAKAGGGQGRRGAARGRFDPRSRPSVRRIRGGETGPGGGRAVGGGPRFCPAVDAVLRAPLEVPRLGTEGRPVARSGTAGPAGRGRGHGTRARSTDLGEGT